jgi:predicted nucleic acid-binding protein
MPTVIFDTDFLCSFLKIDRCSLIRTFYQVEQAFIPTAVHRELARTDLLTRLLEVRWIRVPATEPAPDETLLQAPVFQVLGAGERACISLARTLSDAVLLMSDNQARQFAQSVGVLTVNIPAFLLACKKIGLVEPAQMAQIIQDLKEKDYYEFKSSVRDLLLE